MIMPDATTYREDRESATEWLSRHDHDLELHASLDLLLRQARVAEAVLMLEAHIGGTAQVRARVPDWSGVWEQAVREMQAFRSLAQVKRVAEMLCPHRGELLS